MEGAAEVLAVPLVDLGAGALEDVGLQARRRRLEDVAESVEVVLDLEVAIEDVPGRHLRFPGTE